MTFFPDAGVGYGRLSTKKQINVPDGDFEYEVGVGYGRVSTSKQIKCPTDDLADQRAKVTQGAKRHGVVVGRWFSEVVGSLESEPRKRPGLLKALETAIDEDKPLVVSDLSRITRDEALIRTILESGIEVFAVDLGEFLTIESAIRITQKNRKSYEAIISSNKKTIDTKRAAGIPMGSSNIRSIGQKGTQANEQATWAFREEFKPHLLSAMKSMLDDGMRKMVWTSLANRLNAAGIQTRAGKDWSSETISKTVKAMLEKNRVERAKVIY